MHRVNKLNTIASSTLFLAWLTSCSQPNSNADWQTDGATMGTGYLVKVAHCSEQCSAALAEQIALRLQRLEAQYSHYANDSEVSRFNQHDNDDWFPASHELIEIVDLATEVSDRSDGAFDITVGRAVNAWGFGPEDPVLPPAPETLSLVQTTTGYQNLQTRRSPAGLRKNQADISIDLSAIAKGYAADQLAYMLEFAGLNNYLIEIGGELRIAGRRTDNKPWIIGIEPPDATLKIDILLAPGDNAVATSGDYRNFYVLDSKRLTHVIDPLSSKPIEHGLTSVTVVDPLAAHADAWATALMVMGPEAGLKFAQRLGLAALFLTRTPEGIDMQLTSAIEPLLVES